MKRFALICALLFVSACEDPEQPEFFYEQDFEQICDGFPCGWEQLGGVAGDATFVTSFHPGEHGIQLTSNEAQLLGPSGDTGLLAVTNGTIEARVVAACDPGESLRLQAIITTDAAGGVVEVFSGRITPEADFSGEARTELTAGSAMDPANPFSQSGVFEAQVQSVSIDKNLRGSCTINRLVIDGLGQTGFF